MSPSRRWKGASAWVWTARPDLDASQLFEVMRRSAVDIGLPGLDGIEVCREIRRAHRLARKTDGSTVAVRTLVA